MKIKLDFVTNSSSVSFCGWGVKLPKYFPQKTWSKIYKLAKKNPYYDMDYEEFILSCGTFEDYILCSLDELYAVQKDNIYYIGLQDNKGSKDEIINRLTKNLKKLGFDNDDFKIEYINETWYS